MDYQLQSLQIRVTALGSLCNRIENRIPQRITTVLQVQSVCNAASSIQRALKPMSRNPQVDELIHNMADMQRAIESCEQVVNAWNS
ncbi:unnamed protein product [Adineta steineri]|uniref:Uncharacterized protein n=1 Tax=Adineta steineri TaxID=433720 RepID=A0A815CY15_9BILA|nr:unnamed protein product [Adineta steineri]CAF3674492.1 unnamed protein product [Adineta steineri]